MFKFTVAQMHKYLIDRILELFYSVLDEEGCLNLKQ